jgi:hypothetical protein
MMGVELEPRQRLLVQKGSSVGCRVSERNLYFHDLRHAAREPRAVLSRRRVGCLARSIARGPMATESASRMDEAHWRIQASKV